MCAIACVERVDDADGQDHVEKLGVPVGRLARASSPGTKRRAPVSPRSSTPGSMQGLGGPGQESRARRAMDQQRLGRVADARRWTLALTMIRIGHVDVGRRRRRRRADALVVLQDRHRRLGGDAADQALAAARDGQVDVLGQAQQVADGRAVGRRDELDGVLGQAARTRARRRGPGAGPGWCGSPPCRRGGSPRCRS